MVSGRVDAVGPLPGPSSLSQAEFSPEFKGTRISVRPPTSPNSSRELVRALSGAS